MKKTRKNTEILSHVRIRTATQSDFEHLVCFHYCQNRLGPISHFYKLTDDHPGRRLTAPVVGIIAYGPPAANLAARNAALGGLFDGLPRAAGLSMLNRQCRCIRRVIIEPRYRGLGLAAKLVRETLPQVDVPIVEALSVMGRAHPFFERAGMSPFQTPADAKTERMIAAFEAVGLTSQQCHNAREIHDRINTLDGAGKTFILSELDAFTQKFGSKRYMPHGLPRTGFVLSKLNARPVYYLWNRPDSPLQTPAPTIE